MDKDSLQKQAYRQLLDHHALAHTRALKQLLAAQQPFKYTVDGALAYYNLLKSKLDASKVKELMSLMKQCKENDDIEGTLSKIYNLLHKHTELLRGFGMFLPPSVNVQFQTCGTFFSDYFKQCPESEPSERSNQQYNAIKLELLEIGHEWFESDTKPENNPEASEDNIDALMFLNKVHERFQNEPDAFGHLLQFLESVRDDYYGPQIITEVIILAQISDLFGNHNDLIEEFKSFLTTAPFEAASSDSSVSSDESVTEDDIQVPRATEANDPSFAQICKYGTYDEFKFFDDVKEALVYPEVYENFMKTLKLFIDDILSRSEIYEVSKSFLGKFPSLLRKFKDMLGLDELGNTLEEVPLNRPVKPDPDVDYALGGRSGVSYRAVPSDYKEEKCSGRTPLCKEVLNDTWVSFPVFSEDSTFVTSRKTQHEEMMYRIEDERFELDMAIDANAHTILILENVQKRINKMSAEERSVFSLDDHLGGTSTVLHQKALQRIYGDKTDELVAGLKRNPIVAVPIILKRLRVKEEEWKEKQNSYNVIWKEKLHSHFLKSLDYQGIVCKQNDSKCFRPKYLLNEMEVIHAEKRNCSGPDFMLENQEAGVVDDAIVLLCLYLKKLPGMSRKDRQKVDHVLRGFIPDFYNVPRKDIPEDTDDESDEPEILEEKQAPPSESGVCLSDEMNSGEEIESSEEGDKHSFIEENFDIFDQLESLPNTDLPYTLFFVNKMWYIFFRQFHILLDRLSRLLRVTSDDEVKREADWKPKYERLIAKLSHLLSGTIDSAQFEDYARELYGIHAYVSYTMDKLILAIVRQLQHIVNDEGSKRYVSLFLGHLRAAEGLAYGLECSHAETAYGKRASNLAEGEVFFQAIWHKAERILALRRMEEEGDTPADPYETEQWSNYLEAFSDPDHLSILTPHVLPVILPRNLRKQCRFWKQRVAERDALWKKRYSQSFLNENPPFFCRKRKFRIPDPSPSPEEDDSNDQSSRESLEVENDEEENAEECDIILEGKIADVKPVVLIELDDEDPLPNEEEPESPVKCEEEMEISESDSLSEDDYETSGEATSEVQEVIDLTSDLLENSPEEVEIKREEEVERRSKKRMQLSEDAPRPKKPRVHQDYVKQLSKKNSLKLAKSKKTSAKALEDNVDFDYTYFSELSEEDKCSYLAMENAIAIDKTEVCFQKLQYRMLFVAGCWSYFYRRGAFTRAAEVHPEVSEIKTYKFNEWHKIWLERYVTPAMLKFCQDFLLRSESKKYRVVCLTYNDSLKPPYIPITKYKIRYYKAESP